MQWNVYLSGEIHSGWRQQIADGIEQAGLPVALCGPVTAVARRSQPLALLRQSRAERRRKRAGSW